jgi:pyruvate/2-oxoglutarate dehydrogenase complex dihydrolipoamide acyltransferase (E2) component
MDVLMPQLGETVAEGKISKWFVSAGDAVKPGDNLFEIETDKVSMEVPAIAAGTLSVIHVQAGEVAPVGAVVAIIQGSGETVSTAKPAPAVSQAPLTPAPGSAPGAARGQAPAGVQSQEKKELGPSFREDERKESSKPGAPFKMEPFREVRSPERNYGPSRLAGGTVVTPLARRLAGEAGIDLTNLKGSGPHGRIVAADVEQARKAPALAPASSMASIVLTADVALDQPLALCADVKGIELADVIIKAWATALRRALPDAGADIALAADTPALIRDAASRSLTAIAAARRDTSATEAQRASSAVFIAQVPGIASVAHAVRSPQVTMLSIGSQRRAPIEAPDGSVTFGSMVTVTLTCDPRAVDAALATELLSIFKGFVEKPVTMIV